LANENSDILSRNDWILLNSYRPHSTFVKLPMKGPAAMEAFFLAGTAAVQAVHDEQSACN
jgi:hypothetical protein